MAHINLVAAWLGILLGVLSGMVMGLRFHDETWMGGYSSWPRRMIRLGHISFFGLSFINLAFHFSFSNVSPIPLWPSVLLIAGAILMPLICFMSAWKKQFRHFFFMPVLSILIALIIIMTGGYFP